MALMDFRLQNPISIAPSGRPAAAVEITPEAVIAAATSAVGQAPMYAVEALPGLSVTPGIELNLMDPPAVAAAVKAALGKVQPRVRSVTLVAPDAAVRVIVLDLDTLPPASLRWLRFLQRKTMRRCWW